jgi:hypothetical protein
MGHRLCKTIFASKQYGAENAPIVTTLFFFFFFFYTNIKRVGSGLTDYVDFKFISLPLAIVRIDCTIVRVIEPHKLLVVLHNGISKECI